MDTIFKAVVVLVLLMLGKLWGIISVLHSLLTCEERDYIAIIDKIDEYREDNRY